jgi:hypothetical protein
MLRYAAVTALTVISVVLVGWPALADNDGADRRPGSDGHVTALSPDKSVIDISACARKSDGSWDYVSCGSTFAPKVVAQLCRQRGRGTHEWLYQVGDSAQLVEQTAHCE